MEKIKSTTMDLTQDNIKKLKELFPNVVTEGKIDFDMLKTILGEEVDESREKYQFTWKGKAQSIKLAQSPSSATLRPCKEKSKDWDTTENLYIEGDNLEVLKQLQKSYYGKIKMIYIDPPYNTGNNFVYKDNFKNSLEAYKEQTNQKVSSNPESSGRYHTDWLNMMYSRLLLARNLLSEDGVIFMSIDDNEVENLKKICGEIFGESNFIAIINWKGRGGRQDSKYYAAVHEYILVYAKYKDNFIAGEEIKNDDKYPKYDKDKDRYYKTQLLRKWGSNSRREDRPNLYYPITAPDGTDVYPFFTEKDSEHPSGFARFDGCWRHGYSTMKKNIEDGLVEFSKDKNGEWIAYEKIFAPLPGEENTKKYTTWIDETNNGAKEIKVLFGVDVFPYPKMSSLIMRFIKMGGVEDGDIILDFFSGSSTTAHAVMKLNSEDNGNRKFIMVQLQELLDPEDKAFSYGFRNVCEIGEERIRRAGDQIKKVWKEEHFQEDILSDNKEFTTDIGFKVFKLDSTNLVEWDNMNQMDELGLFNATKDVIKEGRSVEDVLYEIMLKYGIFNQKVTEIVINNKKMYRIGLNYALVCMVDEITNADIDEICKLKPRTVIFMESGFRNDNDKINALYNLEKAGIQDIKCI